MGTVRIAAVSFLLAVSACGAISLVHAGQLNDLHQHRDVATTITTGTIVEDDMGNEMDIRVSWRDSSGAGRTTRFGIYDTDRYAKGKEFGVLFDRTNPDGRVFPSDREETAEEDDLYAGIFLPWLLVIVVGARWLVRTARTARSRRGPPETARMTVVSGFSANAGPVAGIVRTTWVILERDAAKRFQRVAWHPALATARAVEQVQTHSRGGSTTVRLDDGTRLTPIGRTRPEPPGRFRLQPLAAVRSSQADSFLRRPTAPHDAWLRTMLARAAYGTTIGCLPGILVGSTHLVWIGALVGAACAVSVWALYGADR